MADEVVWLRQRLGHWHQELGQGEGDLVRFWRRIWRLTWAGQTYCIKPPRQPDEMPLEARLQRALHAAGFPVARVYWEDEETGLFVMEWIDGPGDVLSC